MYILAGLLTAAALLSLVVAVFTGSIQTGEGDLRNPQETADDSLSPPGAALRTEDDGNRIVLVNR